MKKFLLLFLSLLIVASTNAQINYTVETFNATPSDFLLLNLHNQAITSNDTINERILDLTDVGLVDSILPKRKKPHHKLFLVGWGISTFGGYNWRKVFPVKGKLVGRVISQTKSGEEEYTEFDVNQNLEFHLPKYLNKSFESYDLQKKIHRQDIRKSHRRNYNVPPFVRDPTNLGPISQYQIHTELTPPRAFRQTLDKLFYPVIRPMDMGHHFNFLDNNPSVGTYGPYCLDCNHSCHPELHPYEWLWWLNLSKPDSLWNEKTWLVGLLKEGSNRFTAWAKGPRTGFISIPFLIDTRDSTAEISYDHILMNKFYDDILKAHFDSTQKTIDLTKVNQQISIQTPTQTISIKLHFNIPIYSQGLKIWISKINLDDTNHLVSGYLNIATSVEDVYNARIVVKRNW